MAKKEFYRYTEDGVLLVRKREQGKAGAFGLLPESRELWFQCSEKNPDRQYVQMVLGGWCLGCISFWKEVYCKVLVIF